MDKDLKLKVSLICLICKDKENEKKILLNNNGNLPEDFIKPDEDIYKALQRIGKEKINLSISNEYDYRTRLFKIIDEVDKNCINFIFVKEKYSWEVNEEVPTKGDYEYFTIDQALEKGLSSGIYEVINSLRFDDKN